MAARASRIAALIASCGAVLHLTGCQSGPIVPLADFEGSLTRGELARFLGQYPNKCIPAGPDRILCKWTLGRERQAWKTLAPTVPTRRMLNVLCELPADGSPRAQGSCRLHPREPRSAVPDGDEVSRQQLAQRRLAEPRSLSELSHLVGDLPDSRRKALGGAHIYLWKLSNRTAGFSLVAAAAGTRGQARLECRLPDDGGPGAPGSCIASPAGD